MFLYYMMDYFRISLYLYKSKNGFGGSQLTMNLKSITVFLLKVRYIADIRGNIY